MVVEQDFFDLWSDLRFLKKYREAYGYFHKIQLYRYGTAEERAVHECANHGEDSKYLDSKQFVKHNSHRTAGLAFMYRQVNREATDWATCENYGGGARHKCNEQFSTYMRWLGETQDVCQSLFNQRKGKVLHDALVRVFSLPFAFLKILVGFDIRKQTVYKNWMTIIIVSAAAIYLINVFIEYVARAYPYIVGVLPNIK